MTLSSELPPPTETTPEEAEALVITNQLQALLVLQISLDNGVRKAAALESVSLNRRLARLRGKASEEEGPSQ